MTIQRMYNLPNCTLLVEGISIGDTSVLSILTNFEFRFHHSQEKITGGLKLLEALMKSASSYVQFLQQGDDEPTKVVSPHAEVKIEPSGKHLHNLYIQPTEEDFPNAQPLQIQLNTVQLFDLVESIDQLCSDRTTLPDFNYAINFGSYAVTSRLKGKAIPAIVGVVSLAVAASALYFVPIPAPQPKPATQTSSLPIDKNKPTNKPTPLPQLITDPEVVDKARDSLKQKIDKAWVTVPKFKKDVVYRVAANAKGELVGYKLLTTEASNTEDELPLKQLLVIPRDKETGGSPTTPQSTVSFLLTFKPSGTFNLESDKSITNP